MTGRRVDIEPHLLQPGDYSKSPEGQWFACTPDGLLANLTKHAVDEHCDGTITVSPSILCRNRLTEYHGFLEAGVWRRV